MYFHVVLILYQSNVPLKSLFALFSKIYLIKSVVMQKFCNFIISSECNDGTVGLEVWRVINEPTAAALAYGLHTKPELKTVLVVDLGGGTLDVSLLHVQGGMFLTQGMAGENY